MFVRVLGFLLAITGAVLVISGVSLMFDAADGIAVSQRAIAIRFFSGMITGFAGTAMIMFSFTGHVHRGVATFLKRVRGSRVDEEIARLAKLRGDGYITGEEYETAKKKLLNDL